MSAILFIFTCVSIIEIFVRRSQLPQFLIKNSFKDSISCIEVFSYPKEYLQSVKLKICHCVYILHKVVQLKNRRKALMIDSY